MMAKKTTRRVDLHARIQKAALELAAVQAWHSITLTDIAMSAQTDLAQLLLLYPDKTAILCGFMDHVDSAMLASMSDGDDNEPVRDRLFTLIMSRLDVLSLHRPALLSVARSEARDPIAGLCHLLRFRRSLALILEAAGLSSNGLKGRLTLKGLALIYLNTIRVWADDDSADMAKTMAALDRGLALAGKLTTYCRTTVAPPVDPEPQPT